MPLSIFRGRPMPGPGEPYWLDSDADHAIAYVEETADECSGCGVSRTLLKDPGEAQFWHAEVTHCPGCAAIAKAAKANAKTRPDDIGVQFRLGRKTDMRLLPPPS